jgi:hypothetical protein
MAETIEQKRARDNARNRQRVAAGLCPVCARPKTGPCWACDPCRARQVAHRRALRQADPEHDRAWHRQRKRQHRTAGKCLRCYAATKDTYYCLPCAVYRAGLKRAQRLAAKQGQA